MILYYKLISSLWILLALLSPSDLYGQGCAELPKTFSTTVQAMHMVKQIVFPYTDRITTERSSWVKSATFYSCDRKVGFFLMTTKTGKEYLFQDMPVALWEKFKQADSYGEFYNKNIRNRYQLKVMILY